MNDLVRIDTALPLSAKEVRNQIQLIQEVMRDCMHKGVHYGYVPGTEPKNEEEAKTKKPSLWKPGAEKLCLVFRFYPDYDVTDTIRDGQQLTITTKCLLRHIHSDLKVGSGMGSCSTLETKYLYRHGARTCPACGASAIIKGKAEYGGGWVCFARKGGCGEKFRDDDAVIVGQATGKIVNEDLADQYNTVLKMSNKRALVAATLVATAASDIFTQDLEDDDLGPDDHPDQKKNGKKKETGPPAYPDEGFQKNLPTWRQLIESGTKTADQIIATVESKGTLTNAQKDAIRGPKPTSTEPTQPAAAGAPVVTFATVKDKLQKTNELDMLDAHADLIAQVADKDQREELTEYYKNRRAQLEGGGK